MIVAEHLTRSFPARRGKVTPVRNVSHAFPNGRVTYLLGLNGAGKSTLLRLICGVLRPDVGAVFDSDDTPGMMLGSGAAHERHTGRRHLYWVAAASGLPWEEADHTLHAVGLGHVLDSPISGYSLGMRQRLGIATAILGAPRNIVLDEPFNGLDVAGVLWLRKLLRDLADRGHCVVVASHHLAEVERSGDEALVLEGGSIIASGTVRQLRGTHSSLEEALVELIPRAAGGEVLP